MGQQLHQLADPRLDFCSFLLSFRVWAPIFLINLQTPQTLSSMLTFFQQLVIIRSSLQASASVWHSLSLTCFFTRSALLQTSSTGMFSAANVWICFIHRATELKESLLSTLNMSIMAVAERQKDGVMVLNLYWPAVSHSCIIIFLWPTLIIFWPYSSPTVQAMLCLKLSQQNLFKKEVFPTPESPINIIFTKSSQLSSVRIWLLLNIQMPKLKGKEVKDYVFGQCLLEFQQGSEVARALKGGKMNLVVYGISNHLVDPKTFPLYNQEIVANSEKIYPTYYEIVRSQNFLYMIFQDLARPVVNPLSYEEIHKFVDELQKLYRKTPYKISAAQIFTKVSALGELCIIPPYTKILQKSNNMYTQFYNKSTLAQLFCKIVNPKDQQKATAAFIENLDHPDLLSKLLPFLSITKSPIKQVPQEIPYKIRPIPQSQQHPTKSNANKIMKQSSEEYPDIDEKQYQELMAYVHVNPSLKHEAGQAYMRQSVRTRQEQASNEITEIVNNVNNSIFKVSKVKSKGGKSKVEIKLNKEKLEICEFQVHFEAGYSIFKLFKNVIRSYLEKYRNGFAGIIAAYLLTLIGILRKLRFYSDLSMGVDIYEIGGAVENSDFSKYATFIKKELAKQAKTLVNLKSIIENANMPYKTYEALMPYLQQDLEKVELESAQNFCFFYMTVLMRMSKVRTYHDILALEAMYVLINPQYSIVYSEQDMPQQWDANYFELRKLLISTLVPKWEI